METRGNNNTKLGSDSQDSQDFQPLGTPGFERPVIKFSTNEPKQGKSMPLTPKGVENAKKRLRAFSIQKKSSLSPVSVPKHVSSGGATVFIGKLSGAKTQPKPEPDPASDVKKPPKPPKPGAKQLQDSYITTQKKTLAEIEDMKRKMELVELGIPLGLICPAPNSDKAMPTKAMPPIKSFIDRNSKDNVPQSLAIRTSRYIAIHPAKVDELIREAKKARAEGKEFKFDYHKLLPDYDNPFQRKKDEASEIINQLDEHDLRKSREKDKRRSDKYDTRRLSSHTHKKYTEQHKERYRDDKRRDRPKERYEKSRDSEKFRDKNEKSDRDTKLQEFDSKSKDKDLKYKDRDSRFKERDSKMEETKNESFMKIEKEADVNLKDFVVCDSWSDNEDKSKDSTPKSEETKKIVKENPTPVVSKVDPMEQLRESLGRAEKAIESPKPKLKRLTPVIDSFKFEIEDPEPEVPDNDDILDIFDENSALDKFASVKTKKSQVYDDSPIDIKLFEYELKDDTMDEISDDKFLEQVINEIKQEEIDETSQDKGLVEYDESPIKDDDSLINDSDIRESVTPELDDRVRELHTSRSDYSDGYKSGESICKSVESGYKSTDSLKISENYKSDSEVIEKVVVERKMAKHTVHSLETWSFVLKICQPLLFRHDKNKCYKETRMAPKLWFTENPKLCNCVKDRRVVYKELEMCKLDLVDSLYSAKPVQEAAYPTARGWYPRLNQCLAESNKIQLSSEWEAEDSLSEHPRHTPERSGDISLDKEYQRFMEAVRPEVAEAKSETPRSTPVRREASKMKADDDLDMDKRKPKKMKLSSEGWSQESEIEEEMKNVSKKKEEKQKRKRKHSTSVSITDSSESDAKKKKKIHKKKENKKAKSNEAKRRRVIKKNIKKLKDKQKKKKKIIKLDEDSDVQDVEKEKKKKERKTKKKKQLKQKKKSQKKKKAKAKSSSSSGSSSDSESESEKKSKKKRKNSEKKKKRKKSSSDSAQEELFDVNILNNIKTEKVTDDEAKQLEFSPRRQKPREIINVKELQNDFVGNSIQIKKEVESEEHSYVEEEKMHVEEEDKRAEEENEPVEEETRAAEKENTLIEESRKEELSVEKQEEEESQESQNENGVENKEQQSIEFKEEESQSTPQLRPDESNLSQCSSQESIYSLKDQPLYEKDESHLRPSSQNSNYSFHDVMASGMYSKNIEHGMEEHDMQRHSHDMDSQAHDMQRHSHDVDSQAHDMQRLSHDMDSQTHDMQRHSHDVDSQAHDMQRHSHDMNNQAHDMQTHALDMQRHGHVMELDSQETYEHGDYEMYEQMAMAYQSDVASQQRSPPHACGQQRIETVVRARACGEIKCDWRADCAAPPPPRPAPRPSRWGLKPGDVNIVLTGGGEQFPIRSVVEPVYKIQSIANRTDNSTTDYDEAYMDMYGASDKLQYGDCFSTGLGAGAGLGAEPTRHAAPAAPAPPLSRSLADRIDLALRTTVLGEVAKDVSEPDDKDTPEKGILLTKSVAAADTRAAKRVSFADGYKPGQDSDVESPPVKKRKKSRRLGCAWPCPATHADHVPLWDALPPPPPPPGSPPPPPRRAPPTHLLRTRRAPPPALPPPPHTANKFDPNAMPAFMPPEPPPGLISFQNL